MGSYTDSVLRDPFYLAILEALARPLDDQAFEACTADVLREIYPGLTPVPGGDDAGMDGAIATPEGDICPLVCTVGGDSLGNLDHNLRRFKETGRSAPLAVFATSQRLTPKQRRGLEDRAHELGFALQVYERMALARLLYRHAEWCRDLLGIVGHPPALSIVPPRGLPIVESAILVGRDEDVSWLKAQDGDRLLVGEPGAGKSFLLQSLVLEGWGLFLADEDLNRIADSIRSQGPRLIVIDDAQFVLDLLVKILHLRETLGATFALVASAWPADAESIGDALRLFPRAVRKLELLRRDQVVEIIRNGGVGGPPELLRVIVDQAAGLPGIAAMLTKACLQGDVRHVAIGDALARYARTTVKHLAGEHGVPFLAALGVGGAAGMPLAGVADHLRMDLAEAHRLIVRLGTCGLLRKVSSAGEDPRFAVQPRALREVLVKDVFFSNFPLSVGRLVSLAWPGQLAETLVGARARGAAIPFDQLVAALESAQKAEAWEGFASLGRRESEWLVSNHPELVIATASAALCEAPDAVLPHLFGLAVGDARPLHAHTDHPLRKVADWVGDVQPGTGEGVRRRAQVARTLERWASEKSPDPWIIASVARSILSPGFERHWLDPGDEMKVTLRWGLLGGDELVEIIALWPTVYRVLQLCPNVEWEEVIPIAEGWGFLHGPHGEPAPEELRHRVTPAVKQMVVQLIELAGHSPGALLRLKPIAEALGIQLEVALPEGFDDLFPEASPAAWESVVRKGELAAERLAAVWAYKDPAIVFARVATWEREAAIGGRRWPHLTGPLWGMIADTAASPLGWAQAALAPGVVGPVAPFLSRALTKREPGVEDVVARCLVDKRHRRAAVEICLALGPGPGHLFELALEVVPLVGNDEWLASVAHSNVLSSEALRALLEHPDATVASQVAVGIWQRDTEHEVPPAILTEWRAAITRCPRLDYWAQQILGSDPELGFDWLVHCLSDGERRFDFDERRMIGPILSSQPDDRRLALIRRLHSRSLAHETVGELLARDCELYLQVLRDPALKGFHLVGLDPLAGASWSERAGLVLGAGYSPDHVAEATVSYPAEGWRGEESKLWQGYIGALTPFAGDVEPGVREAARAAIGIATVRRDRATAEERREATFGPP